MSPAPHAARRTLRRTATIVGAVALAAVIGVVGVRCARSSRRVLDETRFGFSQMELSPAGQGPSVDVAFGDAPAPPGARERLRAIAPAGLRTVLTRWAPADARPAAYPGGLPFLLGREVHTAEHVPSRLTRPVEYAGAVGRDARWTAPAPAACDSTFARLAAASAADGWQRDTAATARLGPDAVASTRAGWARTLLVVRVEPQPLGGGRPADGWCAVTVADQPAGGDTPGLPYMSWPYWWDPTWVGDPPPPPLMRRVGR